LRHCLKSGDNKQSLAITLKKKITDET
jgi:hypothetical protein